MCVECFRQKLNRFIYFTVGQSVNERSCLLKYYSYIYFLQTTSLTAPTDIIFAYDGSKLVLKVGSDEVSKPLTGTIFISSEKKYFQIIFLFLGKFFL